jgi:galactokinase
MYATDIPAWLAALNSDALDRLFKKIYGAAEVGRWKAHYREALTEFKQRFGGQGQVVIGRCPCQMNLMGMHIDYGGMPSLRLAVQGADMLCVARIRKNDLIRLQSVLQVPGEAPDRFEPLAFHLADIVPEKPVGSPEAMRQYAGIVCSRREAATGSAQDEGWAIIPQGQLVYLESYFRDRKPLKGMDALVWSNVSPSGGRSSSSALTVSTALAALGVNGLQPGRDFPDQEMVDGIGTSEWLRGTRGGTADHGGMVLGRVGRLVSVGVFPATVEGYAQVPSEYVAIILDTGVARVYDDAVKEETVMAYPLGTFWIREIILPALAAKEGFEGMVPDYKERIKLIRDITAENLGLGPAAIYQILAALPQRTTLIEAETAAAKAARGEAFAVMRAQDIGDKYPSLKDDHPIYLRRRVAFGLAEQDRVGTMLNYMNAGRMTDAMELVRISHDGDLDQEVTEAELERLHGLAKTGNERGALSYLPGGYGRMTPAYDEAVRKVNAFLLGHGTDAGSVQRLGAGWGGNMGGLVKRELALGGGRVDFEAMLKEELGIVADLRECVAAPGEGACLLEPLV